MTQTSPGATHGKCPICGRPGVHHYRPFCSRRCADVDLARWLRGTYAIPVEADDDEDGAPAPATGSDPSPPSSR